MSYFPNNSRFSELKSCQVAIECSIVIIDQYYKDNIIIMQQWCGISLYPS